MQNVADLPLLYQELVHRNELGKIKANKPTTGDWLKGAMLGLLTGTGAGLVPVAISGTEGEYLAPIAALTGLLGAGAGTYFGAKALAKTKTVKQALRNYWNGLPDKEKKERLIEAIMSEYDEISLLRGRNLGLVGGAAAAIKLGLPAVFAGTLAGTSFSKPGSIENLTLLRSKLRKLSLRDLVSTFKQLRAFKDRLEDEKRKAIRNAAIVASLKAYSENEKKE